MINRLFRRFRVHNRPFVNGALENGQFSEPASSSLPRQNILPGWHLIANFEKADFRISLVPRLDAGRSSRVLRVEGAKMASHVRVEVELLPDKVHPHGRFQLQIADVSPPGLSSTVSIELVARANGKLVRKHRIAQKIRLNGMPQMLMFDFPRELASMIRDRNKLENYSAFIAIVAESPQFGFDIFSIDALNRYENI